MTKSGDVQMQWHEAVREFAMRAPTALCWMLVGSAATALHQVHVRPGDVDILLHPSTTDQQMQLLADELVHFVDPDAALQQSTGLDRFLSSPSAPWMLDGHWTFGRWRVAGTKVEVARITTQIADGSLHETMGGAVWTVREFIPSWGRQIPVVPLQVQLETCRERGLTARAAAIERRLELTRR